MPDLYTPPDLDSAEKLWGANCGPGALAAALGRPLADVFDAVADGPAGQGQLPGLEHRTFRGYMGLRQMRTAIERAGAVTVRTWRFPSMTEITGWRSGAIPMVALVQWGGPWVGTRGESVYRHWIALRTFRFDDGSQNTWAYDVNFSDRGGWVRWSTWEMEIPRWLRPPRGDGSWRFQWVAAVERRP